MYWFPTMIAKELALFHLSPFLLLHLHGIAIKQISNHCEQNCGLMNTCKTCWFSCSYLLYSLSICTISYTLLQIFRPFCEVCVMCLLTSSVSSSHSLILVSLSTSFPLVTSLLEFSHVCAPNWTGCVVRMYFFLIAVFQNFLLIFSCLGSLVSVSHIFFVGFWCVYV